MTDKFVWQAESEAQLATTESAAPHVTEPGVMFNSAAHWPRLALTAVAGLGPAITAPLESETVTTMLLAAQFWKVPVI
jgi:hypothetical protein